MPTKSFNFSVESSLSLLVEDFVYNPDFTSKYLSLSGCSDVVVGDWCPASLNTKQRVVRYRWDVSSCAPLRHVVGDATAPVKLIQRLTDTSTKEKCLAHTFLLDNAAANSLKWEEEWTIVYKENRMCDVSFKALCEYQRSLFTGDVENFALAHNSRAIMKWMELVLEECRQDADFSRDSSGSDVCSVGSDPDTDVDELMSESDEGGHSPLPTRLKAMSPPPTSTEYFSATDTLGTDSLPFFSDDSSNGYTSGELDWLLEEGMDMFHSDLPDTDAREASLSDIDLPDGAEWMCDVTPHATPDLPARFDSRRGPRAHYAATPPRPLPPPGRCSLAASPLRDSALARPHAHAPCANAAECAPPRPTPLDPARRCVSCGQLPPTEWPRPDAGGSNIGLVAASALQPRMHDSAVLPGALLQRVEEVLRETRALMLQLQARSADTLAHIGSAVVETGMGPHAHTRRLVGFAGLAVRGVAAGSFVVCLGLPFALLAYTNGGSLTPWLADFLQRWLGWLVRK